jgi:hypothetical protein
MERIKQRAARTYPALRLDLATADWPDLHTDYVLGIAALRLPWHQWEVAFGQLRPTTPSPLAWLRFALLVRQAKREIRRAHAHILEAHARHLDPPRH